MTNNESISNKKFGFFVAGIFLILEILDAYTTSNFFRISKYFYMAIIILFISLSAPSILKPFKTLWISLGNAIGKVSNPIIMRILYYIVFTPYACIARYIFQYNPLKNVIGTETYWTKRESINKTSEFFKEQF